MDTQQFIDKIAPYAVTGMQSLRILASLTIAQAILESGWGKSELATKGNNLFGIKGTGPAGSITLETTEHDANGNPYRTIAVFRKYHSWEESLEDHTKFLVQSQRYQNVIGETDYKRACKKIQDAGYTSDPSYKDLLIQLIERYRLYEYDNQQPSSTVTGIVTVITEALNLRKGPEMSYPVLRQLPKGSQWKVYGSKVNGWYNLGGDQWCSANPAYVSFTPFPQIIGEIKLLVNLNLRSGPNVQHSIIRVMHKNETYKVYGETNGWYNLGGNQWCSANPVYVSFTPSLQAIGEIKLLVDLNLRSGPSMQHSIIRVMHKNETYKVYGETNGWYNLGGNQWCSANPAYAAFKSY